VGDGRRNDTHEIDVVTFDEFPPISGNVFNTEFSGNTFCAFAMLAGYSHDARPHAIAKAGDLSRARETGANNPNSNRSRLHESCTLFQQDAASLFVRISLPAAYL
jgi:hypothetical protein